MSAVAIADRRASRRASTSSSDSRPGFDPSLANRAVRRCITNLIQASFQHETACPNAADNVGSQPPTVPIVSLQSSDQVER